MEAQRWNIRGQIIDDPRLRLAMKALTEKEMGCTHGTDFTALTIEVGGNKTVLQQWEYMELFK